MLSGNRATFEFSDREIDRSPDAPNGVTFWNVGGVWYLKNRWERE